MSLDWFSTAQVIERAVVETNHVGVHDSSLENLVTFALQKGNEAMK